jgi:hypothetical protein
MGLTEAPWVVGMLGVATAIGLVMLMRRERQGGLVVLGMEMVFIVLSAVFLGTLSKDVFELWLVSLIGIVTMRYRYGWVATAAGILMFGAMIRPYWLVVGMMYLGWLVVFRVLKRLEAWQVGIILLCTVVGACVGYWAATGGQDISSVRVEASGMGAAKSAISNLVEPSGALGGVINSLVVLAGLVVPVELFALGDAYHIAAGVLIMAIWVYFGYWLWRGGGKVSEPRAVALILAFLAVSCLFEPDYGSFLRHMVPIIPFMIYAYTVPRKAIS